jgi:hypothetical protein
MKILKIFGSALLAILLWTACEKEERIPADPTPPVSNVPAISLGSMPTTYNQFDDVTLFVNYQDGDGDIGFADADSAVVFVTDNRDDILFTFHVPPLTPDGVEVTIQGTLEVVVENVILLNQSGTAETTTFTVQLIDRAGNWSNEVTTPTLTINP